MEQLKPWIFVMVILIQCPVCYLSAVSWELSSKPAVFGSTTYLLCTIFDDGNACNRSKRQWMGGRGDEPLCQNEKCRTDRKYEVMRDLNMCSYTLMIHNFSLSDVDCAYTCSYGVENMKKDLKLNYEDFIYVPATKDKESQITSHGTKISFLLILKKIYPSPRCLVSFEGTNLSKSIEVNTTKPGIMFATKIHVKSSLPSCRGNLLIECFLGNYKINVKEERINNCEEMTPNRSPGIVLLTVLLVMIVVISIILLKSIRNGESQLFLWNRHIQSHTNNSSSVNGTERSNFAADKRHELTHSKDGLSSQESEPLKSQVSKI